MKRLLVVLLAVGLAVSGTTYSAQAAVAQKFAFKLVGECKEDTYSASIEEDVTGNCYWQVTASPAKPFRLLNLQVKDADGVWQFATDGGEKVERRMSSKDATIQVPLYDEDNVFIEDGTYEYRIYIKGAGTGGKALASKVFSVTYISAGNAMASEAEDAG